jgi:hypothetical protein
MKALVFAGQECPKDSQAALAKLLPFAEGYCDLVNCLFILPFLEVL